MSPGPAAATGFFVALKNATATLLGLLQTRLELASNDIQMAKLRLLRQCALGLALLVFASLALLILVALITLALWEQRLAVLGVFAALFAGLGAYCYAALVRKTDTSEAPFATSLSELQKDIEQLKSMAQHPGGSP